GAGDVDALEPDLGDELGHQWREGAREALQPTGVQPGPKRPPLVGCAGLCPQQPGHRKIPDGMVGALSSTSGATRTFSAPSSPPFRSPTCCTASRNRCCSPESTTPSVSPVNLPTYCSRPKGRAPNGCASATASSSVITSPLLRVTSARAPNAF